MVPPLNQTETSVPISVLIPTRNERQNLGRCLEPLLGWADEIVVVDSQSTDGTVELAEKMGATVLQFHYRGGWPKKRQWALDTHGWRNEWILLLDADEILTSQVKYDISEAIQEGRHDGYWLRFRIVFLGRLLRHGDTELKKLSLFRLGKGRYEKRLEHQDASMADMEIHEHVVVDGSVGELASAVRHENLNSLDRFIAKHNEYSNWEAEVLRSDSEGDRLKPKLLGNQAQRRRWLKQNLSGLPGAPLLRFLYVYVLRLGCLDGKAGFIHAVFKGVQIFHVKAKMYEAALCDAARGKSKADSGKEHVVDRSDEVSVAEDSPQPVGR